jgi:replication factor C subunit 1
MFDNKTLFGGELQDKNLIIMDEVDGMSGNEDRGGIAAIIDIIKKTKTPIICIANDRQSPKLKTLANYCYDLKFVHPDKRTISIRLAEICKKENISCELNALDYICEICGNDIRQIMNFIELWARTHKTIKFSDLTGSGQKMEGKDEVVMLTNFDAAKELLNSKSKSLPFRNLLDLYFIDYDLIPLLIYENYLSTFPSQNYKNKIDELESISLAADCISESDVLDKKIRTNMDWRLLADRGLIGCCTICKINKGFVPFPKFPEALGKISSLNKIKRETTELKECFYSSSGEEIRRQILPVIYTYLVNYIVDGDIDGALEMMKNNHITMELFKENMTDLVSEKLKSSFDKVGTANKSNLTRAYNKNFKTSIIRNKNKKGKNKTSVDVNNEKVFDENGNPLNDFEGENENEEENDESSETVINGKKGKTKTKGNRSRSRSKSKDNKNSKSKDKGKDKKAKGKKKAKKIKKKKDDDDDDFIDDEEYD